MSASTSEVLKMVELYKKVFVLLVSVTALGILLTFIHMPFGITLAIAFVIIAIKGKIILDAFKHLLVGRNAIIILFVLTAIFFASLVLLPVLNQHGHIVGTVDISKELQMQEKPADQGDHHGN